jgi:hypothetical protein
VKIITVEAMKHKLEILWRSRNKLAEDFIVEIYIIKVTYFKFGMQMQHKIQKKLQEELKRK